jgi:hypothetical protein
MSLSPRALIALLLVGTRLPGQPVATPAGWTSVPSGAQWTFRPASVPGGQTFTLTVDPPVALQGQDARSWFVGKANAEAAGRGMAINTSTVQHGANGLWSVSGGYRDPNGRQWLVLYAGAPRSDGNFQFSTIVSDVPSQSVLTGYIQSAGEILGRMSKASSPTTTTAAAPGKAPQARGITSDDRIEALVHEGSGESTLWGFQYVETVHLLLKDGWEYSGLTIPPEDLDVEASKRSQPTQWHHWKRDGATILIERGGQWSKLGGDRVRPLPPGAVLNLRLVHRTSLASGGMGSVNTRNDIVLSPSGQYTRSRGTIAGSGAMQAGAGFSAGAVSVTDQNGTRGAASGTYSGPGGGAVTTRSSSQSRGGDPSLAGTYSVSGYALELRGSDGTVVRVLAFYPDTQDNTNVYIGDATYGAEK